MVNKLFKKSFSFLAICLVNANVSLPSYSPASQSYHKSVIDHRPFKLDNVRFYLGHALSENLLPLHIIIMIILKEWRLRKPLEGKACVSVKNVKISVQD